MNFFGLYVALLPVIMAFRIKKQDGSSPQKSTTTNIGINKP